MTFSKLGLPNMADDSAFANDAYKDRNGVQHAGPASTFNRIIDYIFGVQSNTDSEFTAVENAAADNAKTVTELSEAVTSLKTDNQNTIAATNTNTEATEALTAHVNSESTRINGLISNVNQAQSATDGRVTANSTAIQTLQNDQGTFSALFHTAMTANVMRIIGSFNTYDQLPSLTGPGAEGSYSLVGHDANPVRGDAIYQAGSGSWSRLPNWNLIYVGASLQSAPIPTGVGDIAAIGANGSYVLYQPVGTTDAAGDTTFAYDATRQLAPVTAIKADVSALPAVTSATGSVGVYKYRYTQLDETAFDGQSALVDGKEYVRRNGSWGLETPSRLYLAMAIDGKWNALS